MTWQYKGDKKLSDEVKEESYTEETIEQKSELTDEQKNIEEQEKEFHNIEEEAADEVIELEW